MDSDRNDLNRILEQVPIDLLQFHGDESPKDCDGYNRPFIKAVRMREGVDLLEEANRSTFACDFPEPRVRFRNFGASGLEFELLCWINEPVLKGRALDDINSAVYKRFQQEGIEIPYSKQDIYIKEIPDARLRTKDEEQRKGERGKGKG